MDITIVLGPFGKREFYSKYNTHVEPARVQSKWTLPLYWGHLVKGSFIQNITHTWSQPEFSPSGHYHCTGAFGKREFYSKYNTHVEPARVQSKWTLPLYWGHLVKGSFIQNITCTWSQPEFSPSGHYHCTGAIW